MSRRRSHPSSRRLPSLTLLTIGSAILVAIVPTPAVPAEEGLRELSLPPLLVEKDVQPDMSGELPPFSLMRQLS